MPVSVEEPVSVTGDSEETTTSAEPTLGPDDLRRLAALILKLMKEDLRIERERLGR